MDKTTHQALDIIDGIYETTTDYSHWGNVSTALDTPLNTSATVISLSSANNGYLSQEYSHCLTPENLNKFRTDIDNRPSLELGNEFEIGDVVSFTDLWQERGLSETPAIKKAVSISARSLVTQYALSHSLNMGDALIAAVCLEHNFTLCTSSTKHFKAVRGLNIKRYARA